MDSFICITGNGVFETTLDANGFPSKQDYGNSFLKLSPTGSTLTVVDYFSMWNEVSESAADLDFGSGGAMLLPDLTDATGTSRQLGFGAGKDGIIYVVRRDALGKFNSSTNNIWQQIDQGQEVRSTPAWFNGRIYLSAKNVAMQAYTAHFRQTVGLAHLADEQCIRLPGSRPPSSHRTARQTESSGHSRRRIRARCMPTMQPISVQRSTTAPRRPAGATTSALATSSMRRW